MKTLSDAAQYAPQWRAGFGYEFMERPDGYAGLARTYGLRLQRTPRFWIWDCSIGRFLEKQVDLIAGNSTDGLLAARDLTVLEDDKHYFPPYDAVPMVREDAIARFPEMRGALAELGGKDY